MPYQSSRGFVISLNYRSDCWWEWCVPLIFAIKICQSDNIIIIISLPFRIRKKTSNWVLRFVLQYYACGIRIPLDLGGPTSLAHFGPPLCLFCSPLLAPRLFAKYHLTQLLLFHAWSGFPCVFTNISPFNKGPQLYFTASIFCLWPTGPTYPTEFTLDLFKQKCM